ncbi:MAG TPA: RnfABCDGE type electron transport complex subunit B [Gemmatimonadota bacterium]|nr:RnfABCDGE type electron transport complex subunit B [Gemmatimonadota bacterium]
MTLTALLIPVAILGGLGLTFGALIALAHWKLKVWEDPRIDELSDILPGANCGACGYAGCRAFAEAAITGAVVPAECTVMGAYELEEFAETLGVDAGEVEKRVARLLCAGGSDVAVQKAEYFGVESCAAAVAVSGGGKGCAWGCVGLADCAVSCTFDAIRMSQFDLPVVDPDKCTACNDCVVACPLDLFVIMPLEHHLIVQCRNLLEGEAATSVCSAACNACGRCVADAEPGLIEMQSGLAVIDYDRIELENPAAIARCPTNAIVWVDGAQVFPGLELTESEAR